MQNCNVVTDLAIFSEKPMWLERMMLEIGCIKHCNLYLINSDSYVLN